MRQLVLGCTPILGGNKSNREAEIFAWLNAEQCPADNIIILDDEPELFTKLRDRVFYIDGNHGLRASDVRELSLNISNMQITK